MDFYCRVKIKSGVLLPLEEVFSLALHEDWIRENLTWINSRFAVSQAFGANGEAYLILFDLTLPGCKALIRERDRKVIFSGIPQKDLFAFQ